MLFHGPLIDGYTAGFQKAGAHVLGEDMEYGQARGCRGRVEGLLADEELEVSEDERAVVGVDATPEVLS